MVPTFLQKRSKRSVTSGFVRQLIVWLVGVGLGVLAIILILTSRSLARDSKLSLLTLLLIIMLPGLKLVQPMKS